jgi:putative membrane protein
MWWMHDSWNPWAQAVMVIGMVLFWAIVIGGAIWLTRTARGRERPSDDAKEILDRRLAQGDIDVAEYDARCAAIARGTSAETS